MKPKAVEKLSDLAVLAKVTRKTKARQLLKNIKEQKNLNFNNNIDAANERVIKYFR